ncbi:hypothetical protein Tco_1336351 [Tanacetum coccineum]
MEAYGASHINNAIPRKDKDLGSFTLPCFINDFCFDNALVDLGASVSVMPLSTYLNLGLGELAHIRLIVELADITMKYPKGIFISKEDLKGTRIEHGFKRAFMSLFGQDANTFTSTTLLNVDQLQKQLDKDEFQEDESMTAFWVTQENKIDMGKAVDDALVITESSGTDSEVQDDSSRSGNDTDADDAEIKPIYDEEPKAEVQLTAECNIFAIGQQHTEQPEIINKGRVDQSKTIEQTTSLLANNADLKAQIQEKKPVLQSLRNQSAVRQPNVFKSERPQMSKPRFASQVDMNNSFSRSVTQHYFPERRESVFAKPDHMIASSESRNSFKNMPIFSSTDMVHNHYLDEARKKTQERDRNSKTSVMPSARFQSTADGSKPKPRSTNHSTRSLPISKSSCVTITDVPKADHFKSSSSFSDSKNFIFTRYRFSPNKTFAVYEKTSPRSDLRWKPTGRNFKSVGLRWIPTGKLFDSCTSKDDSEPTHGSNVDIPNIHENKQTLDLSACTSINVQEEQSFHLSAGTLCNVNKENLRFSAVTTIDASNKRQQQPDSTSSTSTLATTVTANGNFDFQNLQSLCYDGENEYVENVDMIEPVHWNNHNKALVNVVLVAVCSSLRLLKPKSYALSWKPYQGDSLNLPDHRAQDDRERQIKMIQVKEMMQDKDLKNSKSKDKGSRSRSQSINEQSHYKQAKTKTEDKQGKA